MFKEEPVTRKLILPTSFLSLGTPWISPQWLETLTLPTCQYSIPLNWCYSVHAQGRGKVSTVPGMLRALGPSSSPTFSSSTPQFTLVRESQTTFDLKTNKTSKQTNKEEEQQKTLFRLLVCGWSHLACCIYIIFVLITLPFAKAQNLLRCWCPLKDTMILKVSSLLTNI